MAMPKAAAREYAEKMREVEAFCRVNKINASLSNDSYYFSIGGVDYRVSNHSVSASDRGMYSSITGEKVRDSYHGDIGKTVCIQAGKTRIIEIYNALMAGKKLDTRGNAR